MATYLKKAGREVLVMDENTMLARGGEFDARLSDADWDRCDRTARVAEDGAIVLGLTEDERREALGVLVRDERARRLRPCDLISPMRWLAMTEEERTAWAQYRQALLDIPQQEGFPWDGVNVPWPAKPGE